MSFYVFNAAKGFAMGIAEVIPGVSGGTIAFITGIYERLLNAIKSVGPNLINAWKQDGIRGVWKAFDGGFVVSLLSGMAVGIVIGVFLITYLLATYPLHVWSYFFGLIVVSAYFVWKQIGKWNAAAIAALIAGTAIAYYVTIAVPTPGNPALWYVFISGAIAISAMLLPGISGSFVLVLMGMYSYVMPTIKEALKTFAADKLLILFVFACGMVSGMVVFSRVITWTFKHYRNATLALLTGFLIGSLNKIWPWQEVISTADKDGETIVVQSQSVLPTTFSHLQDNFLYGNDPHLIGCISLMVVGFLTVYIFELAATKMARS